MKTKLAFLIFLFCVKIVAQVGINSTSIAPEASDKLNVQNNFSI